MYPLGSFFFLSHVWLCTVGAPEALKENDLRSAGFVVDVFGEYLVSESCGTKKAHINIKAMLHWALFRALNSSHNLTPKIVKCNIPRQQHVSLCTYLFTYLFLFLPQELQKVEFYSTFCNNCGNNFSETCSETWKHYYFWHALSRDGVHLFGWWNSIYAN